MRNVARAALLKDPVRAAVALGLRGTELVDARHGGVGADNDLEKGDAGGGRGGARGRERDAARVARDEARGDVERLGRRERDGDGAAGLQGGARWSAERAQGRWALAGRTCGAAWPLTSTTMLELARAPEEMLAP